MSELVLGTKKGLFVLDGEPSEGFTVAARAFAGEPIDYARRHYGAQARVVTTRGNSAPTRT